MDKTTIDEVIQFLKELLIKNGLNLVCLINFVEGFAVHKL